MKFAVIAAAAASSLEGLSAASVQHYANALSDNGASGKVAADAKATPEDVASCAAWMSKVLESPEGPDLAIERAVDHCAISKREDDRNYVCLHFQEALKDAFASAPSAALTAQSFCEVSENWMLALRGATRIANIGHGPLINFKISKSCESTVKAHFSGQETIDSAKVPDLWYGLCMNQDCAHYLPSRTRWCQVQEIPTHSAAVCDAAMKFSSDGVKAMNKASMTPTEVCDLYGDFVAEIGYDVEAYEHVIHEDTAHRIPGLGDKKRALASSRLLNNAGKHHLRDNKGSPIVKNAAALPAALTGGATVAALAAVALSL